MLLPGWPIAVPCRTGRRDKSRMEKERNIFGPFHRRENGCLKVAECRVMNGLVDWGFKSNLTNMSEENSCQQMFSTTCLRPPILSGSGLSGGSGTAVPVSPDRSILIRIAPQV